MVILLQGKDSYRRKRVIESLTADKKLFFEFNSGDDGLGLLAEEAKKNSLFKEKRLLIVFGLLEHLGVGKKILSFLENFTEETSIVLVETKAIPKNQALLKIVNKTYDVDLLKGSSLEKWVRDEVFSQGGEIEENALKMLVAFIGNDLWAFSNEINKLVSYNKKISVQSVNSLVKPKLMNDIFKTIDLMALKEKKETLELIHSHLEKGDSIYYILTMIAYQFRNLILVKNSASAGAKELELHPFVLSKSLNQAKLFSKKELETLFFKIAESDVRIKTGKLEPSVALDLLIFSL